MKLKNTLLTFSLLLSVFAFSQEVSNIYFEQVAKQIHIYYDLEGYQEYTVQVFCSTDDGQSWGKPLQEVSGAIGENQKAGSNKIIVWDVLIETDELAGEIKFKIAATPKPVQTQPNDFSGNSGTFIDERDGQEYKWVRIGKQIWMAENINIGTRIHHKSTPMPDHIIEKYCYDNNESICDEYGGLYNWGEAMQYSTNTGFQGVCQDGWHIPSKEEWSDLISYIDKDFSFNNKKLVRQMKSKKGVEGINSSYYLKSIDRWEKDRSGDNTYGFSALPAGKMNYKPSYFQYLGKAAFFWTRTNENTADAWFRKMGDKSNVQSGLFFKKEAASVRCIKD
ncbi:MAG: hypothetical protein DRI89_11310 [Bacteroidetes bacterium]|nr:MAG: hypothetical protein DRI89_11310 [Bacteroidota bacterium]